MIVSRLELVDFRNYANAAFDFEPGTTAVVGLNGQGKTNLAEAMAYLATLDSFRGAPLGARSWPARAPNLLVLQIFSAAPGEKTHEQLLAVAPHRPRAAS